MMKVELVILQASLLVGFICIPATTLMEKNAGQFHKLCDIHIYIHTHTQYVTYNVLFIYKHLLTVITIHIL